MTTGPSLNSVDDFEGIADTADHPDELVAISVGLALALYHRDPDFVAEYFEWRAKIRLEEEDDWLELDETITGDGTLNIKSTHIAVPEDAG